MRAPAPPGIPVLSLRRHDNTLRRFSTFLSLSVWFWYINNSPLRHQTRQARCITIHFPSRTPAFPPSTRSRNRCSSGGCHCLSTGLFLHFLLHFFGRGFCDMSSDPPGVAVHICHGAATVTPKHIHHGHDNARPKLDGFRDDFVRILHCQVQGDRRAAECFGTPGTAIRILWSEDGRGDRALKRCASGTLTTIRPAPCLCPAAGTAGIRAHV